MLQIWPVLHRKLFGSIPINQSSFQILNHENLLSQLLIHILLRQIYERLQFGAFNLLIILTIGNHVLVSLTFDSPFSFSASLLSPVLRLPILLKLLHLFNLMTHLCLEAKRILVENTDPPWLLIITFLTLPAKFNQIVSLVHSSALVLLLLTAAINWFSLMCWNCYFGQRRSPL